MRLIHFLAEAYDCSLNGVSNEKLLAAIKSGAAFAGATVRASLTEGFQPHGLTTVLILAESHVTLSTWPELDFVVFDALLCNERIDPKVIWLEVERLVNPKRVDMRTLIRGST